MNHVLKVFLFYFVVVHKATSDVYITGQNFTFNGSNRFLRQIGTHCTLPPHPKFGSWTIINKPQNYLSSTIQVPDNTILDIHCEDKYLLDGPRIVACIGGIWIPSIGQCIKICPPIYSTSTLKVTCINGNERTENCTKPVGGTLAEFKCKSYYEDTRFSRAKAICHNGKWSERVPECAAVCGRAALKKSPTLIVRGKKVKKGDFPWQVALYSIIDKELLCGGTLLSERIVLTAAHCVTDNFGHLYPKELYIIVAGKYYRKFDHPEDLNFTQVSKIHEMVLSEHYEGDEQNFMGDIAVIVTKKTLKFSDRIQPACIDWTRRYEHVVVGSGKQKGFVAGWGYTKQNADPANELKSLMVPAIKRKECRNILPDDFKRFMTYDKFCAGYKDNGTSVCRGDSGGGLVFKKEGRFFIAGVVSLAPLASTEEGGCDSQQYSLYTMVYNYTDNLILRKLAEFKLSESTDEECDNCTIHSTEPPPHSNWTTPPPHPKRNNCVLPKHPDFGTWSVVSNPPKNYSPGMNVPSGTTLEIECQKGHQYEGPHPVCRKERWSSKIGKCLKICPSLSNSTVMRVTCTYNNKEVENCTNPVDGTTAKFECSQYYEFSRSITSLPLCLKGSWTYVPSCVPTCGKISNNLEKLKGRYPWHVVIYKNTNDSKKMECEGNLITLKVVVTAAQCVTNLLHRLVSYNQFTIAVGKYHREYNHSDDTDAQFANIERVLLPFSVRNYFRQYEDDLAMIILEKPFKLSAVVQPVCIDWEADIKSQTNRSAFVNIWSKEDRQQQNLDAQQTQQSRPLMKSSVFKEERVKILSNDECKNQLQEILVFYSNAFDKLCTTFVNSLVESLECKTERGAGLVVKENERYYLAGVLSADNGTICERFYGFYTSIEFYKEDFLLREGVEYF